MSVAPESRGMSPQPTTVMPRGSEFVLLQLSDLGAETPTYPRSLQDLAFIVKGGRLTPDEIAHVRKIETTDWSQTALRMDNPDDLEDLATGIALGGVGIHGFANFYAVTMLPDDEVVRSVNASKGRPLDQVASAFLPHEQIVTLDANGKHPLFDLTKLPEGMTPEKAVDLMDALLSVGPFGFQAKASLLEYPMLLNDVTQDGQRYKTIQIIAPGKQDVHSNELARKIMQKSGRKALAITSANHSHFKTGNPNEPAHSEIHKIQREFGDIELNGGYPYIMAEHPDEEAAVVAYPLHLPQSTSIASFHESLPMIGGRPTVYIVRHGSLDIEHTAEIAHQKGVNVIFAPGRHERLPVRERTPKLRGI